MKGLESVEQFQAAAGRIRTPAQAVTLLEHAFRWSPQEEWQDENEAIRAVLSHLGTLNEGILSRLWERATPFMSTLWENPHLTPEVSRLLANQASARLSRAKHPGEIAAVVQGAYERGIFQGKHAVTRQLWKRYTEEDENDELAEDRLLIAQALAHCSDLSTAQLRSILKHLPDHEGTQVLRPLADHPNADLSVWGEMLETGGLSDRVEAVAHIAILHQIPQYRMDMEQEARNEAGILIRAALTRSPGIQERFAKVCLFSPRIAAECLESEEFQQALFPLLRREDLLPLLEHTDGDVRLKAMLAVTRLPSVARPLRPAPSPRSRG